MPFAVVINGPQISLRMLTLPVLRDTQQHCTAITDKVNYKSFILIINHLFGCVYYIFIYYTIPTTKFNLLGKLQTNPSICDQAEFFP